MSKIAAILDQPTREMAWVKPCRDWFYIYGPKGMDMMSARELRVGDRSIMISQNLEAKYDRTLMVGRMPEWWEPKYGDMVVWGALELAVSVDARVSAHGIGDDHQLLTTIHLEVR